MLVFGIGASPFLSGVEDSLRPYRFSGEDPKKVMGDDCAKRDLLHDVNRAPSSEDMPEPCQICTLPPVSNFMTDGVHFGK